MTTPSNELSGDAIQPSEAPADRSAQINELPGSTPAEMPGSAVSSSYLQASRDAKELPTPIAEEEKDFYAHQRYDPAYPSELSPTNSSAVPSPSYALAPSPIQYGQPPSGTVSPNSGTRGSSTGTTPIFTPIQPIFPQSLPPQSQPPPPATPNPAYQRDTLTPLTQSPAGLGRKGSGTSASGSVPYRTVSRSSRFKEEGISTDFGDLGENRPRKLERKFSWED